MQVPNKKPSITAPYRIAVIGEAPGKDEVEQGVPFVGASGRFLAMLLSRAGISREACFIGNVCQTRPPANDIKLFEWQGDEIQDGLSQLRQDLQDWRPHLCVLLGNVAMKAAKDPERPHPLKPGAYSYSVDNWRGSLFRCDDPASPFYGLKCIATYHPAYALRDYAATPLLSFDLKRARSEGNDPVLLLPEREYNITPTIEQIEDTCEHIIRHGLQTALDIEGGIESGVTCLSLSYDPLKVLVVPFLGQHEGNYFPDDFTELRAWRAIDSVLSNPAVPKTLQNCLYEGFVFGYLYRLLMRNVADDTMLKAWELYCELPKDLGTLASLFTREPYYKVSHSDKARKERRTNPNAWREYLVYNGKDSCVTNEINTAITPHLDARARQHYEFNLALLQPILYMELRGILYDSATARARQQEVLQSVYSLQEQLNVVAGAGIGTRSRDELRSLATSLMCYKRNPGQPKKEYVEYYPRVQYLLNKGETVGAVPQSAMIDAVAKQSGSSPDSPNLTTAERAELSIMLDLHMNMKSPDFKDYLYGKEKLPLQLDPKTDRPTTNYEALLKLVKKTGHPACKIGLDLTRCLTRSQMLQIRADADGRIRCGYNIVGTETGRLSCYTSPTGSGYNLQTIPHYTKTEDAPGGVLGDRDLFLADDGYWFFQCDLAGADGWTVAAHCKALGDSTMLEDYLFGLKPAKNLALMLRHGASISSLSRQELAERGKEVKKEDWDYFACKIGQHGTCYLMGPIQLANKVLIESEGKMVISAKEARDLQELFLLRYRGVKDWHRATQRRTDDKPAITSASGHRRFFFGRKGEILGEALAHEPQANTTYATNMAAWNLWNDPENRLPVAEPIRFGGRVSRLRIEPLHQVHDALCGQFRKEDTAWAVPRIRRYFNNPMIIAGQRILIPFEGQYGPAWGKQGEKYGGGTI